MSVDEEESCIQPCVEDTEDNEVTHDTMVDTNECLEEPVCDTSNQETTEPTQDGTPSDSVLCDDAEPATVTEVSSEEPVMHVDEVQPAEEHPGDEMVDENQPSEDTGIDSGACTDEKLDEDIIKDEPEPTIYRFFEYNEQATQDVECPETQESEVAELSVLTTEKEGERKSVTVVSEDDSQREPPSPGFRKDRKRRMSIRRLSDAFVRNKFPGPVENPAQEVKHAIHMHSNVILIHIALNCCLRRLLPKRLKTLNSR